MYTPLQPNQKTKVYLFLLEGSRYFSFLVCRWKVFSVDIWQDCVVWRRHLCCSDIKLFYWLWQSLDRADTELCFLSFSVCLFCSELAVSQTKLCSSVSFSPLDELDLCQSDDYFCFQLLLLIVELYIFVQAEHTTPQNRLKNNPRSGILDYIYMCSLIHYFHRLPLVLELQLEPQPFVRSNSIFYILP